MQRSLLAAVGLAAFLILWEAVPRLGLVSPLFLPPPTSLPQAFLREISGGYWLDAVIASLRHYCSGWRSAPGWAWRSASRRRSTTSWKRRCPG